jgi:hypothetical protein
MHKPDPRRSNHLNDVVVLGAAVVLVENDFDEVDDDDKEEVFGNLPAI